jgi:predicted DNA-binding protein (UPF0251 family)
MTVAEIESRLRALGAATRGGVSVPADERRALVRLADRERIPRRRIASLLGVSRQTVYRDLEAGQA